MLKLNPQLLRNIMGHFGSKEVLSGIPSINLQSTMQPTWDASNKGLLHGCDCYELTGCDFNTGGGNYKLSNATRISDGKTISLNTVRYVYAMGFKMTTSGASSGAAVPTINEPSATTPVAIYPVHAVQLYSANRVYGVIFDDILPPGYDLAWHIDLVFGASAEATCLWIAKILDGKS